MSNMRDYRTEAELALQDARIRRIQGTITRATTTATSANLAARLSEPPAVVEAWTNRFWTQLRSELSHEDALWAINMLIAPKVDAEARALIAGGGLS